MNWMRENMKAFIWLAVIAFGSTIFAAWGMGILGNPGRDRFVATVDGQRVEMEEYQRELRQIRERHTGPITEEERVEQRRRAFDRIVDKVLINQLVETEGAQARPEEIRQWFMARPEFRNEEGKFDARRYQNFIERVNPIRRRKLEEAEKNRIETMRFYGWLQSKVDLTDTEANELIRSGFKELDLYGIYIEPATYISDERIRNYYLSRSNQFLAPPRANVRVIFFEEPPAESKDRGKYLKQVRRHVDYIRRRADSEDEFARFAQEYSQDTQTASQGGLLGWVYRKELNPSQASAVFGTEPGNISELVRGKEGYYLYFVRETEVGQKKTLPEVKEEIENRLLSDTHWKKAKAVAQSLYEEIKSADNSLSMLRKKATFYSGSAARNRGEYGWFPVRFVYLLSEQNRNVYQDELSDGFVVEPHISASLAGLESGELSAPVRSRFGYHIFYSGGTRPGQTGQLTSEDRRQLRQFLAREKSEDFIERWLKWRRKQADVELKVEPERVGKN